MVATRMERAAKIARQAPALPTLVRTPERVRTPPAPHPACLETKVNSYETVSYVNGDTLAHPQEGEPGAIVEFRFPYGLTLEDNHTMAVRFMRRRGPDFAPAGERVVITLDARGRKCGEETFR